MVVFQNYSLLPWLTARENIALAVDAVMGDLPKLERQNIVDEHIQLVGLAHAADKLPQQLSGGMKQRVAIARALALRPKLLLLDEPFGALDALTRGNLQDRLAQICEAYGVTAVMVTHDIDEAVLLSDRIVMLESGPASQIGQILEVDIPRPRNRLKAIEHPSYYKLRSEVVYFLSQQKRVAQMKAKKQVVKARHGLEKVNISLGFVPLAACAPLAIAKEKGLFEKHGLDEVSLVRETSWRGIADGIGGGYLDAAQMPSGMPSWMTVGGWKNMPTSVLTSLVLARNGNAITLSKVLYDNGVQTAEDLKQYLLKSKDRRHIFGVVHSASMHNLLLRYWLAGHGIHPDHDVQIETIPPAQMLVDLRSRSIDGYCVGEPWNLRAASDGVGFTIATDLELWQGHPGKVLGVREDWANAYPNTHIALIKALLEACQYCADPANQTEIQTLLSDRAYVGVPAEYIELGDPKSRVCSIDKPMEYAHHQFFGEGVNRPSRTETLWIMTQQARWGDVPFPRNWMEILERTCRISAFSTAARELGFLDTKYRRDPITLFDGIPFNPDDPIEYLTHLEISNNVYIAEVLLSNNGLAVA
ncbi:MAG: ATP-binding cassette domain-containing protein, partial [Oscillatoriales cyanobacterium]